MAISLSNDERRRHAARHELRAVTPASAKPKKGKRTVVVRPLPFLGLLNYLFLFGVGGDLLSHNLPVAVPSACAGLASGFGMGPGVSLQLLTTDKHAKHKPLWVPTWGGCCVRYCIVDAVTTVTMFLYSLFLLLYQCVGVCCGQLVPVAFTPYSASRSGLSTLSSLGDLNETSS